MKLSFIIVLVFSLVVLSFSADVRTGERAASGAASGASGGTGVEMYEGAGPLQPPKRSKEIEKKRGGSTFKPRVTCETKLKSPCLLNSDCPCTGFCYYPKQSTVKDGRCTNYDRKVHN